MIENRPERDAADPPWLAIARAELGVKEAPGIPAHPRILEYLDATTLRGRKAAKSDETPWCAAFVNWVMQRAEHPSTLSAMARSWLQWGRLLQAPRRGAVCILSRGRSLTAGHVGFVEGVSELHVQGRGQNFVRLLGGNQRNAVSVQSYPVDRVLGYRWPAAICHKCQASVERCMRLSAVQGACCDACNHADLGLT